MIVETWKKNRIKYLFGQHNHLCNAYRAADQQYRSRSRS